MQRKTCIGWRFYELYKVKLFSCHIIILLAPIMKRNNINNSKHKYIICNVKLYVFRINCFILLSFLEKTKPSKVFNDSSAFLMLSFKQDQAGIIVSNVHDLIFRGKVFSVPLLSSLVSMLPHGEKDLPVKSLNRCH